MLDPLSALSIAGCAVQFVDFSIKLVSTGVELYENGTLSSYAEVEQATRDLTHLTEELAQKSQVLKSQPRTALALPSEEDELAVQRLAGACWGLGNQLLSILGVLKAQKSHNGVESFRKAVKTARKKEKIEDIEGRLKTLKDQLSLHLLAILKFGSVLTHKSLC
jgi:hypothetical protein